MKKRVALWVLLVVTMFALAVCTLAACDFLGGAGAGSGNGNNGNGNGSGNSGNGNTGNQTTEVFDLSDLIVTIYPSTLNYTGSALEPEVRVRHTEKNINVLVGGKNSNEDLVVTYSNNTAVGTATATVTASQNSKRFTGTKSVNFEIVRSVVEVQTLEELKLALADSGFFSVRIMTELEIPEGEEITVLPDCMLDINGKVTNYGTIINNGKFAYKIHNFNYGTIINNAEMLVDCYATLVDFGSIEIAAGSTLRGNGVILTHKDSLFETGIIGGVEIYKRVPTSEAGITPVKESTPYTGNAIQMELNLGGTGVTKEVLSPSYENNVNAGTATIHLAPNDYCRYVYGSFDLHFEITKIPLEVRAPQNASGTLNLAAISNPNYSEVRLVAYNGYSITLYDGFTVESGCTLRVMHNIAQNSREITIEVKPGATVIFEGNATIKGTVKNSGTVSFQKTLTLLETAKIENTGSLNINLTAYLEGNVANGGTLNVGESGEVYAARDIIGNAVTNSGTLYVNGNGTDVVTQPNASTVRRVQITSELIHLSQSTFRYDQQAKIPQLTFGNNLTERDVYTAEYKYQGETSPTQSPIDVGTVDVTVTFNNLSKNFYGQASTPYVIEKGEATITANFASTVNNPNYCKVTTTSTVYVYDNVQIREDLEVVVAEDAYFITKGTLTVKGSFTVDGTYINYKDDSRTGALVIDGGSVQNNGKMIFNDVETTGITGSGSVAIRKPLTDASISIVQARDVFYKDKTSLRFPTEVTSGDFKVFVNGTEVPSNDFTYSKLNDYNSGTGRTFKINAAEKSEYIYGQSGNVTVEVKRSSLTVSSFASLYQALTDLNEAGVCNYYLITVTTDLTMTRDDHNYPGSSAFTLTVPENTTLDFTNHTFTVVRKGSNTGNVNWQVNGTMMIDTIDFGSGVYFDTATGGELVYYMSNSNCKVINSLVDRKVTKVVLTSNLASNCMQGLATTPSIRVSAAHKFTFDTNGHEINVSINFYAAANDLHIISSAITPGKFLSGIGYTVSTTGRTFVDNIEFYNTTDFSGSTNVTATNTTFK